MGSYSFPMHVQVAFLLSCTQMKTISGLLPNPFSKTTPDNKLVVPPSPMKWPVVGTLPDFFARGGVDGMCEVHESMYRDFGTVYSMSLMGDEELVLCDPRLFSEVGKKEGRFPIGGAEMVSTFADYYEENNLEMAKKSVTHTEEWKEWRKSLNPDMFVAWDTYLPSIAYAASVASEVAGREVNEGKLSFEDFISRMAFDMFSAVLFGESPRTVDSDNADPDDIEFVKNTQKAFDITGALMSNPLEKVFGSQLYLDFVESMDKTFDFATQRSKSFVLQAQRDQNQVNSSESDQVTSKCPMQGMTYAATNLINQKKRYRNPTFVERLVKRGELSTNEIAETTGPLLMAGVDTTAYVMSWLYLNLASNLEVQDRLADELHRVLNGSDVTTTEQLDSLPYLRACIRESHRLTPSAPISVKKLTTDITIDGKYKVEAGRRISLNLRAFPMDPNYVQDPHQYKPERFLPEAIAAREGTMAEIIDHPLFEDPFGRGKRACLGGRVAYAEIMSSAARLIQDWEISLPSSQVPWKPKQKLMLKASPYPRMELRRRRP